MTPTESDRELRAALIAEIESAFASVSREDGVTLREARVMDQYGTDEERSEARTKDADRRWQDIAEKWIEEYADTLVFLDAKGLRYYIAPFMIWALRHYDESASYAGDAAVYVFGGGDLKVEKRDCFNAAQSRAIAHFLQYFAGRDDADHQTATEALNKHWGKFL
jgi:hypothetical protein